MVTKAYIRVRRLECEIIDQVTSHEIDSGQYRDAMSRLANSVHVVTTDGPAGRRGITATAVCSVSDEPATVLVCVNRRNPFNAIFTGNGVFAVNTLAAGHRELARAFAGEGQLAMEERFALGQWESKKTGAPALEDALVVFDCIIDEAIEAETHSVLIGKVTKLLIGDNVPPLVYHGRDYHVL